MCMYLRNVAKTAHNFSVITQEQNKHKQQIVILNFYIFTVTLVMIPCRFGSGYQCFGGTSCLILQGSGHKTTILTRVISSIIMYHPAEDLNLSMIFVYRVIHSEVVRRK